jgi:hypothetical protein
MHHGDLPGVGRERADRDVHGFARRCVRQQRLAQRPAGIDDRILPEQRRQVHAVHDRIFGVAGLDETVQVADHEQPAALSGVCRQHFLQVCRHQFARCLVTAKPDAKRRAQVPGGSAQHQRGPVIGKLDRAVAAGRQLQEHGRGERNQKKQDQTGDEIAQNTLGNGNGRHTPGADADLQRPLLEKQLAKFCLGHEVKVSLSRSPHAATPSRQHPSCIVMVCRPRQILRRGKTHVVEAPITRPNHCTPLIRSRGDLARFERSFFVPAISMQRRFFRVSGQQPRDHFQGVL